MDGQRQPTTTAASGWPRAGSVVVVLLVAVLVVSNRSQVPAAWRAVAGADLGPLALAALLSLLHLAIEGQAHRASLRSVGVDPGRTRALELGAAAHFLNAIAKSGGMAGLAVFSGYAVRRGVPRGPVVAAYVITMVLVDVAFGVSLTAGIVLLAVVGRSSAVALAAAAVYLLYVASRLALIVYGARSRAHARRLYALPHRVLNRVGRHRQAPDQPTEEEADELFDALSALRRRPATVAPVMLWAFGLQVVGVSELAAVLASVGGAGGADVAVAGYTMALLFGIVGVLPSGVGFSEISLGVVLVSFGSTVAEAAAAVALYRLVQLWLPVGIGAVAARRLRRPAGRRSPS